MRKVKIGKMSFVGLWKEHKGLMTLLFVGGVILVLAAMAPGAWATPNQSPLRGTIPPPGTIDGFVCYNNDGVPGCQILTARLLRRGVMSGAVDVPIPNETVTLRNGTTKTTTTNADGYYKFEGLVPGSYVVGALGSEVEVTLGEGEGVGQDFSRGMAPVGGIAIPVNRFELLVPWIGLAALMAVVVATVVVRLRKQA
jgi:hypothetical protein